MSHAARPLDPDRLLSEVDWARRLARALVGASYADDVAQEALRIALERRPAIEPDGSLRAWLGGVIGNLAGKVRERRAAAEFHERRALRDVPFADGGADLERVELQRRLADAVLALDEPYRSAIVLRYFDELEPRAVAERQGISYDAARQRISRGVALLRAHLDREDVEHARPWGCVALALADEDASAPLAVGTGGIVMGIQTKLAVCGLTAAIGGVALWWVASDAGHAAPATLDARVGAELALASSTSAGGLAPVMATNARGAVEETQSAAPTNPAVDRGLDLRGIVLDPRGDPVVDAAIAVYRNIHSEVMTLDLAHMYERELVANARSGVDGTFVLSLDAGRAFQLCVTMSGYAEARLEHRHAGEFVRVELQRAARVEGRVTRRAGGAPLVDTRVEIVPRPAELSIDRTPRVLVTDGDGRYHCDDLPPGEFWIQVFPREDSTPRWRTVEVRAGDRLQEDFVVEPGHRLRGRVLDATTDAPIADAEVGEGWNFARSVRTDARGEFVFPGFANDGQYQVSVRARGFGLAAAAAREPGGPFQEFVELRLTPGRSIVGRVLDPAGRAVPNAYVAAVGYHSVGVAHRPEWIAARTDADGRFLIEPLCADLNHALVVRQDGLATCMRQVPLRELDTPRFDVGDVVLAAGSTVRGVVVDESGQPVPGFAVGLRGLGARFTSWESQAETKAARIYLRSRTSRADDRGLFSFTDVEEGTYTLVGVRDDSTEVEGPSIDVPAGGDVDDARIVVPRGVSISGRVQDREGRGVRAFVTVSTRDRKTSKETRASADGTFSIRGFGAVPHMLTARPETQWGVEPVEVRHALAAIEVGEGDSNDVHMVVARAELVRGRVLDSAGAPIERAGLFAQPIGGIGVTRATTNSLGEFSLWLAEGVEHEIVARVDKRESPTIAVLPGGDPLEIRVP